MTARLGLPRPGPGARRSRPAPQSKGRTRGLIGGIRQAVRGVKPDLPVAINTLPFHPGGFDNAVEEIGAAEFVAMVDAVERSPVDGLCLFTLTNVLERRDSAAGRAKADRIRRFRA